MTYAARSSTLSRGVALICSAAVHAALGLAFLASSLTSASEEGIEGAHGDDDVLVVTLMPLPSAAAPARDDESRPSTNGSGEAPPEGGGRKANSTLSAIGRQSREVPQANGQTVGSGTDAAAEGSGDRSAVSGADVQIFRSKLLNHIERFRQYPAAARQAGQQGVARIQFVMDREGNIREAWIEISSGSAILDAEALAAVQRSQPLPRPPADWPDSFGVSLPIGFKLQ